MVHSKRNYIRCFFTVLTVVLSGLSDRLVASSEQPLSHNNSVLANQLHWKTNENLNQCHGFFQPPSLDFEGNPHLRLDNLTLFADHGTLLSVGWTRLKGHLLIKQRNRQITAGEADIYRSPATGQLTKIVLRDQVKILEIGRLITADQIILFMNKDNKIDRAQLTGHVHLYSEEKQFTGDTVWLNWTDETGYVENASYQLSSPKKSVFGTAKRIEQLNAQEFIAYDGTYTTCSPLDTSWFIHGKTLKMNRETGRGEIKEAQLYFKSIPFFKLPRLTFGLKDQRHSGFLPPSLKHSTISGQQFIFPYYANLAPNYDATFAIHTFSKRGVMWEGEFRFLTETSKGVLIGEFLPNDAEFKSFKEKRGIDDVTHRYRFFYAETSQFNANWSSSVHIEHVSDDYYQQNFGRSLVTSTKNQLLHQANLLYRNDFIDVLGQIEGYQTLHPVTLRPIMDANSRTPRFVVQSYPLPLFAGFEFQGMGEYVYFNKPLNEAPNTHVPSGQRVHGLPTLTRPIIVPQGYVIPRISMHSTVYEHASLSVPIINIDTQWSFQRSFLINEQTFHQLVEPRLFYLYVPFKDQSDLPNFDSSYSIFTYQQLFRTNRFDGFDRIGDTNQVSIGLNSRIVNDLGEERFAMGIGQAYYFQNRRVRLCAPLECVDETIPGFQSLTANTSPLVGYFLYHINSVLYAQTDFAWSHLNEGSFATIGFYYQPNDHQQLAFKYGYLSEDDSLNQFAFDYDLKLNSNWRIFGQWGYNVSHDHFQKALVGLEYAQCCWAIRVKGGRVFNSLNNDRVAQFNTKFSLDFVLRL